MNPIIEAIEAGHVSHGEHCKLDREEWPCLAILAARAANAEHVRHLQHLAAAAKAVR